MTDESQATSDLAALGALLIRCVLPEGWVPSAPLVDSIALSPCGETLVERLMAVDPEQGRLIHRGDATLAALIAHGPRDEPYVLATRESVDGVTAALSEQIRNRVIQFPWRHGDLSVRAYDQFWPDWLEDLDMDQSGRLLGVLPQGLFQLGRFVTGPLGLVRAGEERFLPPTRQIPGFYCDDAACSTLHVIEAATGHTATADAWHAVPQIERGPNDYSWEMVVGAQLDAMGGRAKMPQPALAVLADCLMPEEVRDFTAAALEAHGRELRDALISCGRRKKWADRPSLEVATELGAAASLQLLGALPDAEIVELLDDLLLTERLRLPAGETRSSQSVLRIHRDGEIGARGFRHGAKGVAPVRLQEVIEDCFDDEPEELAYLLGVDDGSEAVAQALQDRLAEQTPVSALMEFVLVSRRRRRRLEAYAGIAMTRAACALSNPDEFADVVAWKLGFQATGRFEYVDSYRNYRNALLLTAGDVLVGSTVPGEAIKGEVRSASVNYFVAVEELLNTALAFATYALTADLLAAPQSRFVYSTQLGQASLGGVAPFETVAGDPTAGARMALGELSASFAALARRLDTMRQERIHYVRDIDVSESSARSFPAYPLRHRAAFLDVATGAADKLLQAVRDVDRLMNQVSFVALRNRLEHWREEELRGKSFPTFHEIREACDGFDVAFAQLYDMGLAPMLFNFMEKRQDRFRRVYITLVDSDGRRVDLRAPSRAPELGLPLEDDQLVVLGAPLGASGELLRFHYRDPSPFSDARLRASRLVPSVDEPEAVERAHEP